MSNTGAAVEDTQSVLTQLRRLIPDRGTTFGESLRIAELQASRLLALTGIEAAPVPSQAIADLPRISVRSADIPTSGASYWDGQQWIIYLNRQEPRTRQRLTLLHEYKHIIDHGRAADLYSGSRSETPHQQAEHTADYFAGCVLVPRMLLKRAWWAGVQDPAQLAAHFDVSQRALEVRLMQAGLGERPRCPRSFTFDSIREPVPAYDVANPSERLTA